MSSWAWRQILALSEECPPEWRPHAPWLRRRIAADALVRGRFSDAIALLEDNRNECVLWYGTGHPETERARADLEDAHLRSPDRDEYLTRRWKELESLARNGGSDLRVAEEAALIYAIRLWRLGHRAEAVKTLDVVGWGRSASLPPLSELPSLGPSSDALSGALFARVRANAKLMGAHPVVLAWFDHHIARMSKDDHEDDTTGGGGDDDPGGGERIS